MQQNCSASYLVSETTAIHLDLSKAFDSFQFPIQHSFGQIENMIFGEEHWLRENISTSLNERSSFPKFCFVLATCN